jgi:capsular polysaccharide export protein
MQFFGYNVAHAELVRHALQTLRPGTSFRQLTIDQVRQLRIPSLFLELLSPVLPRKTRNRVLEVHLQRKVTGSDDDKATPRSALASTCLFARQLRDVDYVVVWNGLKSRSLLAAETAKALGKPVIFAERGLLPNTVQLDRVGVNANSRSLRPTVEHLKSKAFTDEDFAKVGRISFAPRPLGDDIMAAPSAPEPIPSDLPAEFLLFAAQVHDDSQISWFSPRFPTVESAIKYTILQAMEYESRTGQRLAVVVKPHPQDHGRISYQTLSREFPAVRFIGHVDNQELIRRCKWFVTINSSMSLQAIHTGIPVVTLGEAAYNIPGVAQHLEDSQQLSDLLEMGIVVDMDLRRRYLAHLVTEALLPFDIRSPSAEQASGVAHRILELVGQ